MKIRTVTIDNNGTPLVINESDFRHGSDRLWGESALPDPKPRSEAIASHKGGGRWIVEVDGEKAHEGFMNKSEAKAFVAQF